MFPDISKMSNINVLEKKNFGCVKAEQQLAKGCR